MRAIVAVRRIAAAAALLAVAALAAAMALVVGLASGARLPSGSRTGAPDQVVIPALSVTPDRREIGVRSAAAPALPAEAAASALATAAAAAAPARPASLAGTDVDGALALGDDGRFRFTPDARRLFDYFLTAIGELDRAAIRRLVAEEAAGQLPGHEQEVLDGFDRYLAYLDAAQAATSETAPGTDLRDHLETLSRLQRSLFGDDTAARVFGDDDALAAAILDQSELAGAADLSPSERQAQVDAIEARLPPRLREARARMRAPALVREQVERARLAGAGASEIWAMRAQAFGSAAADRLAELDGRR